MRPTILILLTLTTTGCLPPVETLEAWLRSPTASVQHQIATATIGHPAPTGAHQHTGGSADGIYRGMGNGTTDVARWRPLVETYWVSELVEHALCIIRHESGGNPNAKNTTSTAAGLFQFLQSTWDRSPDELTQATYAEGGPYNPDRATATAAWLQAAYGWGQWSANRKC